MKHVHETLFLPKSRFGIEKTPYRVDRRLCGVIHSEGYESPSGEVPRARDTAFWEIDLL